MAYVHIAHDCIVGDNTVFSNNATLAGHVEIGDYAILSGFSGVHQFCRIGAHAFIGMNCMVNGDVPPFVMMAADYGRPRGVNSEGLKRRGFSPERIAAIKRAYRALYVSKQPFEESRAALQQPDQLAADAAPRCAHDAFSEFIERWGSIRLLYRAASIAWLVSPGSYRLARIAWLVSPGSYRLARIAWLVSPARVTLLRVASRREIRPSVRTRSPVLPSFPRKRESSGLPLLRSQVKNIWFPAFAVLTSRTGFPPSLE